MRNIYTSWPVQDEVFHENDKFHQSLQQPYDPSKNVQAIQKCLVWKTGSHLLMCTNWQNMFFVTRYECRGNLISCGNIPCRSLSFSNQTYDYIQSRKRRNCAWDEFIVRFWKSRLTNQQLSFHINRPYVIMRQTSIGKTIYTNVNFWKCSISWQKFPWLAFLGRGM